MKNKLFAYSLLLTALLFTACNKNKQALDESPVVINNQLTSEEKQYGVMTPELMWKFRRLGDIALSPDGSELLYTVTDIDLETEKRVTNIYKMSSSGGDPVQLTQQGGNSPQWSADGKTIYYIGKEGLASMDANGSNKKNINGLDDFETYIISPDNSHILFTRRVKLDETANEKYGLEKANVRIIDNLMYRHWDYWSDYSYSHIFVAKLNGNNV
ncbi:MAG: PD40 domain-containing protein, partial [Bacteroidales bacterium]|nr:PD40 domain-containing protein [Bacteroidales bacterium]